MSFQQGLSGLNSASKSLDVISSNISNVGTVGFKASETLFANVFAASLTGQSSSVQAGAGSKAAAVRQSFTQGSVRITQNPLDMAISGGGFFGVERPNGDVAFTRNGQFTADRDGFIVNAFGDRLLGWQNFNEVSGQATFTGPTAETALRIPTRGIDAEATTRADISANLRADTLIPEDPFDADDPDTYSFSNSLNLIDSQGVAHVLRVYYVKTDANQWQVYVRFPDGEELGPHDIEFDSAGRLIAGAEFELDPWTVVDAAGNETGAEDLEVVLNFARLSQNSSPFSVNELRVDGRAPGEIVGISLTSDGIVQGRYSNGNVVSLGQVVLATFRNPNGLISIGDNLWVGTTESGPGTFGTPGGGTRGTITGGAVEESTVDVSSELVALIIAQRNYQANAQSIRTQDQILQTVINLR